MHLAVDGFGADQEKLTDEGLILRFLEEYPETLGMKKISLPQVHVYRGPVHEDWGISGFILIAESHISVHTFPDRGYVNIDIFSCKDFDADASVKDVKITFGLSQVKVWKMGRGTDYSTTNEAHQGIETERSQLSEGVVFPRDL